MQCKISNQRVVFFDGICNLCQRSIKYLIKYDKKQSLKFASLQGEYANKMLHPTDHKNLESILYFDSKELYTKSTAILKICNVLGGWHKILLVGYLLPKFIRNMVYDVIAQNRYKWFGRQEHCMVPTNDLKNRFIE